MGHRRGRVARGRDGREAPQIALSPAVGARTLTAGPRGADVKRWLQFMAAKL